MIKNPQMLRVHEDTTKFLDYLAPWLGRIEVHTKTLVDDPQVTAEALVDRYLELTTYLEAQTKLLSSLLSKNSLEAIRSRLLELMNKVGSDSLKCDSGTAYKSRSLQGKVTAREAYLDWCLDHWPDGGGDMLQVGAPQVDALKRYLEENGGPPPGVETSTFVRVNVRGS